MTKHQKINRKHFIAATGTAAAGLALAGPNVLTAAKAPKKARLALVGTGSRGSGMWGRSVVQEYGDIVEFVGLSDPNPLRMAYVKKYMGVDCPTFTNFDEMMTKTKPDRLIVTTPDSLHHDYTVRGLAYGSDVIVEKPMATDEKKVQSIIDAEKKYKGNVTVTFNARHGNLSRKLKEILMAGTIGDVTSVDFNEYLDTDHGASYFRRWHGIRENSGTLLLHKSSHHFDKLNWWIDSDPVEAFGYGDLEFYGKNGPFRSTNCRPCPHKNKCEYFWDITKAGARMKGLYIDAEKADGYLRDACLFREEIDIYDKMGVTIKYKNNVQVVYSLTTYSPYEGEFVAFNGTKGRLEAMNYKRTPWARADHDEIRLTMNFGDTKVMAITPGTGGHGGSDVSLKGRIFRNPSAPDPMGLMAGTRAGAMSSLIGIAASKSIDTGKPVRIDKLVKL